jgi:hypothetical protein
MFILHHNIFLAMNTHFMIIIGIALVFTMGFWSSSQLSPFVVVSAQTQATATTLSNDTQSNNISATYFGTLTTHPRSEGFTYSEGKAVIYTEDGEIITHTSQGMGGFDIQTGKIKNHGSTIFSTNSTGGKLGFLNNMIGIWADEIDPGTGIAHAKTWLLE